MSNENTNNENVLSAQEITDILAGSRNRGGLDTFLTDFSASEKLYLELNKQAQFKGKSKEQLVSVKNQLTMKAKKADMTNIRLAKNGDTILIINTDLLPSDEDSE